LFKIMTAPAEMHSDALPEGNDELRTLISAILSGDREEKIYLRDVSSICQRKPASAGALRAIIDRYHRLGRMPAGQHQRIHAQIEQAVAAPQLAPRAAAVQRGEPSSGRADGYPFEDLTCDLSAEPVIGANSHTFPREPSVRVETLVDSTPTLETPAPRFAIRAVPAPRPPGPALWPPVAAAPAASAAAIATPLPEAAIAVGQVLHDRYELQTLLGRGGMASVYKALDRDRVRLGLEDCFVAIKVVPANATRQSSPAALGQEFQSAQRLSHPNVINVFDIDHDGDTTFYSMELLSGTRLSHVLRRIDGAVLQRRYALAIIRDIGGAVAHAHSRGVVHADLKPSNVMITLDGEVRVLDFGGVSMPTREPWVSEGDDDEAAYQPATPAYASCEQLERRRADPRDDLYALACIAYVLLAGRHPFDHVSSIEARARGMRASRPAGMSLSQWRALRRALAWGREQQTMSIEHWLAKLGVHGAAPRLPPLAALTAAVASRHPWRRAAAAALPLLAVGVGVWALQSHADADWNQALSAAVNTVQDTLHEAWQSVQSLAASDGPSNVPAEAPVALPVAPPVAPPVLAASAATPSLPQESPAKVKQAQVAVASGADAAGAVDSNAAPHVAFAAQSYAVGAGDPAARIVIRRLGKPEGELSFVWWTEAASAEPDVDYASLGARTEHMASGQDKLTVYVPIISNSLRTRTTQFHVALVDAGSHRLDGNAQSTRATVTIEGGG
jgi:Ser/Thr protein kinase RdoA (MazF antagonist)